MKRFRYFALCLCALSTLWMIGCSKPDPQNTARVAVSSQIAVSGAESETSLKNPAGAAEDIDVQASSTLLKQVDWEAFKQVLPKANYKILQNFIPILTGNAKLNLICCDSEKDEATYTTQMVSIEQFLSVAHPYAGIEKESLILNSIAFCDVFQSGNTDMILLFENYGWEYLILHAEAGKIYGVNMPVRCFESLQKNGIYYGSGSGFSGSYARMQFSEGAYTEYPLADFDEHPDSGGKNGTYRIGGEKVTKKEFKAWEKKNASDPVEYYESIN